MAGAHWLWAVQAASTWGMVGLIWMVQLVHYPLFSGVGPEHFPRYSAEHSRRITWVVLPLMSLELGTSYLLWRQTPQLWETAGLWLVGLIWLSTGLFFAPLHHQLCKGFCPKKHSLLVRGNWFRTVLWSARGLVVFLLCHHT